MPLRVGERGGLRQQRLEAVEHLAGEGLEAAPIVVARVDGLHGVLQPLDAPETAGADQRPRIEPETAKVRLRRLDGFDQSLHALFDRDNDLLAPSAVVAQGVLRKRLAEALQHAVVVDDQPVVLAWPDPVRPRDRLHQVVRLHRLVDVERGQALNVETGKPHGADDGDAEGMVRVLERRLHINALAVRAVEPALQEVSVRNDVETPLPEVADLVLRLADDQSHDGLFEPGGLGRQLPGFLIPHGPHFGIDGCERFGALGIRRRAHTRRLCRPPESDELQHPCARDLVDAHQHRLA